MISTRIRQTKHIAFGLGLLLCTSLASAAQISAGSTIAFFGTKYNKRQPARQRGGVIVCNLRAKRSVATGDFACLFPSVQKQRLPTRYPGMPAGAITAPADPAAQLW